MNYGSMGFLMENFQLSYKQEVLSAFCLGDNSKLYGLYYPCPDGEGIDDAYKDVTIKHDFILTPIPPRFWPVSARIHVYLKQKPGTLSELCEYLKEKRVSIVHAESSRSSYRYATWSLHIVFEDLIKDESKLVYNKELNCYEITHNIFNEFIESFKSDKANFLYSAPSIISVDGTPNYSLAYFHYYRTQYNHWVDEKLFLNPFELTLNSNNKSQFLKGDDVFNKILQHLTIKEKDLLPATTFSEIDTKELNLRTVLISKENIKRFFKVSIAYNREGAEDSCVGIIHALTSLMQHQYNIWHSYNYTINSQPKSETGKIVFLIEDVSQFLARQASHIKNRSERDNRDNTSYAMEAINHFSTIIREFNLKNDEITFETPEILPLPQAEVMDRIFDMDIRERKYRNFEYDVFISYSHQDKRYVHDVLLPILDNEGILYHLDSKELEFGQRIDNTLFDNIKSSREMCVIFSEHSAKSEWVITERGAAWILDMLITPITLEKIEISELLSLRLRVDGTVEEEIKSYAKEIIKRRNENMAKKFKRFYLK